MRHYYFLFFFIILALSACSQEENIISLESEQDFKEVSDFLKDNDVVVIGESTHYSKDIDELKIDLIKSLQTESDYDVLALETSYPELNFYLNNKDVISPAIIQNEAVSETYRRDSFEKFFNNLDKEQHSIDIHGMNWQPVLYDTISYNALYLEYINADIRDFNNNHANLFSRSEFTLREITEDMIYINSYKIPFEEIEKILLNYNTIIESDYFTDLDSSSQQFLKERVEVLRGPFSKDYIESMTGSNNEYYSRRGLGMFNYISNLVDEGNKVIVWVHNFHILLDPSSVSYPNEEQAKYMANNFNSLGLYLKNNDLDVYTIGLYFNQADDFDSLYFNNEDLEHITDDRYLEGVLASYEMDKIFVDLSSVDWASKRLLSYDEGYIEQEFIPIDQYDGIIYLDKIEK